MNLTKRIGSAVTAIGMSAVCLCSGAQTLFADDALALGDVNSDTHINASDAAQVLIEAAKLGAGGTGTFTDDQRFVADINKDGIVNASDAAMILVYAAYVGAGGTDTIYVYYNIEESSAEEPTDPGKPQPDPTYNAGNWRIGAYPADPGDIVRIPITAANVGEGLNSFIVQLNMAPELTLVSVESGDDADMNFICNQENNTIAGTQFSGNTNQKHTDNTVICYLNIKVSENATSGSQFTVRLVNFKACDVTMQNGYATFTPGTITVN